jgi:small GTP-binding protein
MSESEYEIYIRKIVLLGDAEVGKTSLIRRFVANKYDDKYLITVGTKVTEKNLLIKHSQDVRTHLKLMIWDFMGQKGFKKIESSGLNGASGALMVYDISRAETLASIEEYWLPRLEEDAPGIPIILLANKIDLRETIENDTPEALALDDFQKIAHRNRSIGFFTSALSGQNVENAFIGLGKRLIKNISKQSDQQLIQKIASHVNGGCQSPIIKATDDIIMDFHTSFGGDFEETMPIIRRQFEKAGVDINDPTIEGLRKAVKYLCNVESNFWPHKEVSFRLKRRLSIINQLNGIDIDEYRF